MSKEFDDSLEVGEKYEKVLDEHFRQWFDITEVSMDLQRLGIDRIFVKRNTGERFSVEYKTDLQTFQTGNVFVETVSVDKNETKGWSITSTAQLLFYFVPQTGKVYIMDMMKIRDRLERGWKKFKTKKTAAHLNKDYCGEGILVPILNFKKEVRGMSTIQVQRA